MITGYDLVNEYYEEEKLYSTGDDYLDDLLEKAFCDGYEYAQREFGNKENKAAKRDYEMKEGMKRLRGLLAKQDKDVAVRLGRNGLRETVGRQGSDPLFDEHKWKSSGYVARPLEEIGQHRTSRGKLMQWLDKKEMNKDLERNITNRGGGPSSSLYNIKKSPGSWFYDHGGKKEKLINK